MSNILSHLKPELVWHHFGEICKHPRPSRKEEKIAQYVIDFAIKNNLEYKRDNFGNIVIKKPATKGYENKTGIVLQGHLDMVAEKNSDVTHDFENDPIQPFIDGDWVRAKGTTLGSDNGIGVAAALAVLESNDIEHGPIEALFTLDEETGLFGAQALQSGFLEGKILINLDSEEDGALYIGCSGGKNSFVSFPYNLVNNSGDSVSYQVKVTGLKGGHSGLEIHTGRVNAIKVMARVLLQAVRTVGIELVSINGGSKHNAIPRETFANVVVSADRSNEFENLLNELQTIIKAENSSSEPDLKITYEKVNNFNKVIESGVTTSLLRALMGVPNGVFKMSYDIPGLVETSTNLAVIETTENTIEIILSQRSSVESEKEEVVRAVGSVFELAGATVKTGDGYPGWKPNIKSPILATVKNVYKNMYGNEPEVKAIHAGLECGIINEKYPYMDMISFGPTILGAHSPDERVQISTVAKFWDLLKGVLKNSPSN